MERRRDHPGRCREPRRTKRCVRCGFDGPAAQHAGSFHDYISACPACGVDFYARPPRSYAELEGFTSIDSPRRHRSRLVVFARRALVVLYRPLISPVYRTLVRVPADRMMLRETAAPKAEVTPKIKARQVSPKRMVRSR